MECERKIMYVVFIRTKYNKLPRNEKGKNSWVFILQIEAFYIKQKKNFYNSEECIY